jgi:thiamine biosynthesis lipoprotein
MRLDLGGIGKGYAAQQAVDLLKSRGVSSCMVALAGDVVAGNAPPESDRGWRVEFAERSSATRPRVEGRNESSTTSRSLLLADAAVSTSGDTEQFIDIAGTRYSHIIDPRTGIGLTAQRSVTVIAPRGELADALSSALCVLGTEGAESILKQFRGSAAIFQETFDGQLVRTVVDPAGVIDWTPTTESTPSTERTLEHN